MCKGNKCACKNSSCICPSGRTPRFLQASILLLINNASSYGYELMDKLREGKFLETQPDPGAVYRILRKLEDEKCIVSKWQMNKSGPAKKIYSVTFKGRKLLKEWVTSIQIKRNSLNRILKEYKQLEIK
jgi:poly-beta-hydroxybutyrate-responsive repressor